MKKSDQHVVPRNGSWAVRRTGADRATKLFETQKEAIEHARTIAKKEKSELFVHRRDGTISTRNSYGNDPFPPKDGK